MRALLAAALLPLVALAPSPARAGSECHLTAGPGDRVAQDQDLVIPAGATVENAVVLRGNLTIERGAKVRKAVAAGGRVTLRPGAVVTEDAVAIGGDLVLEGDARVGEDAVALGGEVRLAPGARVGKDVTSLSLQFGGSSLARAVMEGLKAQGPCEGVQER